MRRVHGFVVAITLFALLPNLAWGGLLNPGDLAFIGFNTDGNDDFAIALMADAASGTVVRFNDNEWQGSSFNSGEGSASWTLTQTLLAGTVVTFSSISNTGNPGFGASSGVLSGALQLASGGETMYAFIGSSGSSPTTFLAAVSTVSGDYSGSSGTLTGTGLTQGMTAVLLPGGTRGGQYSGNRTNQVAFADYVPLIGNTGTNWSKTSSASTSTLPFNTTPFQTNTVATPEPATWLLGGLASLAFGSAWRRRRRATA
jgi:hypothetical protein